MIPNIPRIEAYSEIYEHGLPPPQDERQLISSYLSARGAMLVRKRFRGETVWKLDNDEVFEHYLIDKFVTTAKEYNRFWQAPNSRLAFEAALLPYDITDIFYPAPLKSIWESVEDDFWLQNDEVIAWPYSFESNYIIAYAREETSLLHFEGSNLFSLLIRNPNHIYVFENLEQGISL